MDEYFCPNCGAILNDQHGFSPDVGAWTCTSCGMMLMDDDVYDGDSYDGVAWFCDGCGALLNRQFDFSDKYDSWICTECGHQNGITDEDIVDLFTCPNCSSVLNNQWNYNKYSDDHECASCGVMLHRDFFDDAYRIIEDKTLDCPQCGAHLKDQICFEDYEENWQCTECGAYLHREYCDDDFEVVANYSVENNDNTTISDQSEYRSTGGQFFHNKKSIDPPRKTTEFKVPENELRKTRVKSFFFKRKKIQIKCGYAELTGLDIEAVELKLYNQAFNNIKKVPIKDIYINSPYKVGQVEQVIIAGSSYFNEGDLIPYDAEIIVTYHVKREIVVNFTEKDLRKLDYITVRSKLSELGFTEICERPIKDLVTGWIKKDGRVEKVVIGDEYPFKKNSVFEYDAKIIIEYHTFSKKNENK